MTIRHHACGRSFTTAERSRLPKPIDQPTGVGKLTIQLRACGCGSHISAPGVSLATIEREYNAALQESL